MLEIVKSFISSAIFAISLFGFGMIIFNNKLTDRKSYNILMYILISIIITIAITFFDGTVKTLLECIGFVIIFYCVFNISITKSIFTTIIFTILNIIPELIILNIMIYIIGIDKEYCYSNIAGGIIINLVITLTMIILTYIFRKPLRKLVNYSISTSKKIVFISVLAILFVSLFFYKFAIGYRLDQNVIGYIIAMFAFMIILFVLYKEKIDNEKVSQKYDELLSIMKNYESDIEEQRTLRHETKNELMTIKCKLNDKEKYEEIIKYIDSIAGDKVSINMIKFSKFTYLPSNGLKGFFYYKFMEAEKNGIKVSVNISKKIENCFLKDLDAKNFKELVHIIGVYLDNAIEASKVSDEKKLGIELYYNPGKATIIISNTFDTSVNLEKIGKEVYSTKGKNRGHGLMLVKRTLKENNMFEAKTEIDDNLYIQTLYIKEKE